MSQASPARAAAPAQQPAAGLPQGALLEECAWAVTADKIDAVVARLVAVAAPLRLIAFGSAARAPFEGANDLDLLVVEPTGANRYSEVVRLQKALRGLLIPVDLVVSIRPQLTSVATVLEPWSSPLAPKGACCMTPPDPSQPQT